MQYIVELQEMQGSTTAAQRREQEHNLVGPYKDLRSRLPGPDATWLGLQPTCSHSVLCEDGEQLVSAFLVVMASSIIKASSNEHSSHRGHSPGLNISLSQKSVRQDLESVQWN